MKEFKHNKGIRVGACLALLAVLLSFSERKMDEVVTAFKTINVIIENNNDNHYLDQSDVVNSVNTVFIDKGYDVNLKVVEAKLLENPYIRESEVYRDLKNNLHINVKLRRPLARIIRKYKSHLYISYDGITLPISNKYTSRVPLISGAYAKGFDKDNMFTSENDKKIFDLINKINNDDFFSAQISQLEIDNKLNIKMYPQVTKQVIEFGKPVDIDEKFRKLMIFYRKILPHKGWNSYSRVNVNFEGQIVAE